MNTAEMTQRISGALPRLRDKIVAVYYLLAILTGAFVFFFHAFVADLIAAACFIAVTVLFHDLSRPGNRSGSLLAASFTFVGFALGKVNFHPSGSVADPVVDPAGKRRGMAIVGQHASSNQVAAG